MRDKALITIVRDDKVYLPVFLQYYRNLFEDQDIYIYDNSDDPTTLEGVVPSSINLIPSPSEHAFNHRFLVDVMNKAQVQLLQDYKCVIHADVDEIIVTSPNYLDLDHFLYKNKEKIFTTTGYEIYHSAEEPELDWNQRPLLEQRSYWYICSNLHKPLITREKITWTLGHHSLYGHGQEGPYSNADLFLLHLHKIDWKTCQAETERKRNYNWSPHEGGSGFQNRLSSSELEKWFREQEARKTKYPEWVSKVI